MKLLNRAAFAFLVLVLGEVAPSTAAHLTGALGLTELSASLEGVGTAQAAFIRRGVIKVVTNASYRLTVVVGDDATTNLVKSVSVAIQPESTGPKPLVSSVVLPLKAIADNGNKRFSTDQLEFAANAVNSRYTLTMIMLDAKGVQVGDKKVSTVEVDDDGDARVRSLSINQLDPSSFQVRAVIIGDVEEAVAAIRVKFTDDYEGPAPLSSSVMLSPIYGSEGRRVFALRTLKFADPAGANDEAYNVVIDLQNSAGVSLGSSERSVVVDGGAWAEIAGLQADLEAAQADTNACLVKVDTFKPFVDNVIMSTDELLILSGELDKNITGLPESATKEALKKGSKDTNILLHELRGLALEVTLD